MKKLRIKIKKYFTYLNQCWLRLPLEKQRKYILLFFIGYFLLTVVVMLNAFRSTGKAGKGIVIEHIENPVIKKREVLTGTIDSTINKSK